MNLLSFSKVSLRFWATRFQSLQQTHAKQEQFSLHMVPPGEDFTLHFQQRSQNIDAKYVNAWTVKERIFTYIPSLALKLVRE